MYQHVICCPIKYNEAWGVKRAAQHPPGAQSCVGCCAYLVHLLLSLTACLAPPVFTSWTPSLTTCCPQRGGHCQDDGETKVGMCSWWSRCATHESILHFFHSFLLMALQRQPVFILHLQAQRQVFSGRRRRRNGSAACTDLFRRLLSPFPSLSFLSLSFSYTIRSEVKQAALCWVCSSLTPHLQANSGQDEEGGGRKEVPHGGVEAHALKMNYTTSFLHASWYSNRAVRRSGRVWKVAEAPADMVKEH